MQKLKDYNGYQITPTDWGYYVVISDTKANQMRTYEYDGACGTAESIEQELKSHSFSDMVKRYRDQFVYCECVEQIY